jgi:hypothetical protein
VKKPPLLFGVSAGVSPWETGVGADEFEDGY